MAAIQQTSFMGVKPTDNNPMITEALNASDNFLDIKTFMQFAEISVDPIMLDNVWQLLVNGCNDTLHVERSILFWLGYEGNYKKQKSKFKKFLKKNKIPFKKIFPDTDELELYPSIKEELKNTTITSFKSQPNFLIMNTNDLKIAMMKLKTENGDKIRHYYIEIEKIMKLYYEYSLCFKKREFQTYRERLENENHMLNIEMNNMKKFMMDGGRQNNLNSEDEYEVEDTDDEDTDENKLLQNKILRFVIIKRNNRTYPYYTIKGQDNYVNNRIIYFKTDYPRLKIIFDVKTKTNSNGDIFTKFKELNDDRFIISGNNIQTKYENDMLRIMKKLLKSFNN